MNVPELSSDYSNFLINKAKKKCPKEFNTRRILTLAVAILGASMVTLTPFVATAALVPYLPVQIAALAAVPFIVLGIGSGIILIDRRTHFWGSAAAEFTVLENKCKRMGEKIKNKDSNATLAQITRGLSSGKLAAHGIGKKLNEAFKDFSEVEKADPKNIHLLNARAEVCRVNKSHFEQGLADVKKVLEIEPLNAFALATLGDIYRQQGRFKEAEEALEKVLTDNKQNAFALTSLGEVYSKQGNTEKALELFHEASYVDPHNPYIKKCLLEASTTSIFPKAMQGLIRFFTPPVISNRVYKIIHDPVISVGFTP